MATVHTSIVIERSPTLVFNALADLRRHPEWDKTLLQTKVLDEGPFREGTRGVEQRKLMGRQLRASFIITRSDPPERYDFRTTDGPVQMEAVMRCATVPGGTRVSYDYILRGLMAPLVAINVRRASNRNLSNLKRILESDAVGS